MSAPSFAKAIAIAPADPAVAAGDQGDLAVELVGPGVVELLGLRARGHLGLQARASFLVLRRVDRHRLWPPIGPGGWPRGDPVDGRRGGPRGPRASVASRAPPFRGSVGTRRNDLATAMPEVFAGPEVGIDRDWRTRCPPAG